MSVSYFNRQGACSKCSISMKYSYTATLLHYSKAIASRWVFNGHVNYSFCANTHTGSMYAYKRILHMCICHSAMHV